MQALCDKKVKCFYFFKLFLIFLLTFTDFGIIVKIIQLALDHLEC